jgi:predicted transcriptional regulator
METLKLLWELGPSPAGAVREAMQRDGREWAYTTTKTVLDRLEEKGYARRNRQETPHVYVPVSPSAMAGERLRHLRDTVFDGCDIPLVRALLDGTQLSHEAIAELRAALDAMDGEEA